MFCCVSMGRGERSSAGELRDALAPPVRNTPEGRKKKSRRDRKQAPSEWPRGRPDPLELVVMLLDEATEGCPLAA